VCVAATPPGAHTCLWTVGHPKEENAQGVIAVENFHFKTRNYEIKQHFHQFGDVVQIVMMGKKAYVTFDRVKDAYEAALDGNGTLLQGKRLQVTQVDPSEVPAGGGHRWHRDDALRKKESMRSEMEYRARVEEERRQREREWEKDRKRRERDVEDRRRDRSRSRSRSRDRGHGRSRSPPDYSRGSRDSYDRRGRGDRDHDRRDRERDYGSARGRDGDSYGRSSGHGGGRSRDGYGGYRGDRR